MNSHVAHIPPDQIHLNSINGTVKGSADSMVTPCASDNIRLAEVRSHREDLIYNSIVSH